MATIATADFGSSDSEDDEDFRPDDGDGAGPGDARGARAPRAKRGRTDGPRSSDVVAELALSPADRAAALAAREREQQREADARVAEAVHGERISALWARLQAGDSARRPNPAPDAAAAAAPGSVRFARTHPSETAPSWSKRSRAEVRAAERVRALPRDAAAAALAVLTRPASRPGRDSDRRPPTLDHHMLDRILQRRDPLEGSRATATTPSASSPGSTGAATASSSDDATGASAASDAVSRRAVSARSAEAASRARASVLGGDKLALTQTVRFGGQEVAVTRLVKAGTEAARQQVARLQRSHERAAAAEAARREADRVATLLDGEKDQHEEARAGESTAPPAASSSAAPASSSSSLSSSSSSSSSSSAADVSLSRATHALGLSGMMASLEGAKAISTLEKSSIDWDQFKSATGIEDELARFTKDGFVARREFLQRATERERDAQREQARAAERLARAKAGPKPDEP